MESWTQPFLVNLDRHLRRIDWTRVALANATGISVNTINTWFQYDRPPRIDYAYRIADKLGVTVEYLMTGTTFYEKRHPTIEEIIEKLESLDESGMNEVRTLVDTYLLMKAQGYRRPDQVKPFATYQSHGVDR